MKIHNYGSDYKFQQQKKDAGRQADHTVKYTKELTDYAEYQIQADRETSVATAIVETENQSTMPFSEAPKTSTKRKRKKEKE